MTEAATTITERLADLTAKTGAYLNTPLPNAVVFPWGIQTFSRPFFGADRSKAWDKNKAQKIMDTPKTAIP